MNPILNQLISSSLGNNNILNMYNTIRNSSNPNGLIQSMMESNPQMKQVMDVVQRYNGDARSAFYALAKEKGVDPNVILKQLR